MVSDNSTAVIGKSLQFDLATTQLDILANRLWKTYLPDRFDFVYSRIWLHANQVNKRFHQTSIADILAGLKFCSDAVLPSAWNTETGTTAQVSQIIAMSE